MARHIVVFACSIMVVTACGSSSIDSAPPASDATPEVETAVGCSPGETRADDGHCTPAGVSPSMCAKGFESDGSQGCKAILPAEACPSGQMAIPGETICHEVAPCGSGTWGDIPVETSTQFVDRSFTGTSDGSMKAPWKTIGDGIKFAASGAIVAIAAGSYAEDLVIGAAFGTKSVRLWGVCPAKVEIVGSAAAPVAAVTVGHGASGSELHQIGIRGASGGVGVSGAKNVTIDRVWIHDTADRGVEIDATLGATSVVLTSSLVEHGHDIGVYVSGSEATIEGTVVRDTIAAAADLGRGVAVEDQGGKRASVMLRGCLVERNQDVGVAIAGSDVTIEATEVRDTQARSSDHATGRGINVQDDPGLRASLTLRGSVVERSRELGVFVSGSDATIEQTVVRDIQPRASDRAFGRGIVVQADASVRASLTLRASLVQSIYDAALYVLESDALLDGVIVRDTKSSSSDGLYGDGIVIVSASAAASASITGTRIEGSARVGLSTFGASVTLESTALECNTIHLDGEASGASAFSVSDLGGNGCGCTGTPVVCQVLSNGLAPPAEIPAGK